MSRQRWHASPGCWTTESLHSLPGFAVTIVSSCFREFASSPHAPSCVSANNIEKQHPQVQRRITTENENHWYIPMHKLFLFISWHHVYLLDTLTYVFYWGIGLYTLSFHYFWSLTTWCGHFFPCSERYVTVFVLRVTHIICLICLLMTISNFTYKEHFNARPESSYQ